MRYLLISPSPAPAGEGARRAEGGGLNGMVAKKRRAPPSAFGTFPRCRGGREAGLSEHEVVPRDLGPHVVTARYVGVERVVRIERTAVHVQAQSRPGRRQIAAAVDIRIAGEHRSVAEPQIQRARQRQRRPHRVVDADELVDLQHSVDHELDAPESRMVVRQRRITRRPVHDERRAAGNRSDVERMPAESSAVAIDSKCVRVRAALRPCQRHQTTAQRLQRGRRIGDRAVLQRCGDASDPIGFTGNGNLHHDSLRSTSLRAGHPIMSAVKRMLKGASGWIWWLGTSICEGRMSRGAEQ